jgi:hypothetical protein
MNNLRAYQLVDTNRTATTKQLYAVASHFAKLEDNFSLRKVFGAILLKFNAEHCDTPITMGDVSKFLELKKVPVKFTKLVNTKKPTVSKKVIVAKGTVTKEILSKAEKEIAKEKSQPKVAKPKASEQSLKDFEERLKSLKGRMDKVESHNKTQDERLEMIERKMDMFMAFLESE